MAKDKAAKERAREKKKKEQRVRDQARRQAANQGERALLRLLAGDASPSALAAFVNARTPLAPLTGEQKDLERFLEKTGLKKDVDAFVRQACSQDHYGFELVGPFTGSAFYVVEGAVEGDWELLDEPLSTRNVGLGPTALSAFAERLKLVEGTVCGVWVLWADLASTPIAVAFAVHRDGASMAWSLAGDGVWYLLNKVGAMDLLAHATDQQGRSDDQEEDEADWLRAFAATTKGPEECMTKVDADEDFRSSVFEAQRAAQAPLHHCLVMAARQMYDEQAIWDMELKAVEDESFERGVEASRKQIDQLGRKLAEAERRTVLLERRIAEVSVAVAPAVNPSVRPMPLADRLASIFLLEGDRNQEK